MSSHSVSSNKMAVTRGSDFLVASKMKRVGIAREPKYFLFSLLFTQASCKAVRSASCICISSETPISSTRPFKTPLKRNWSLHFCKEQRHPIIPTNYKAMSNIKVESTFTCRSWLRVCGFPVTKEYKWSKESVEMYSKPLISKEAFRMMPKASSLELIT